MEVVTNFVYRALSRLEILYIVFEQFALKKIPFATETALGICTNCYAPSLSAMFTAIQIVSYMKGAM